ncbi:hypothetical protein KKF55_00145 [Patescibacteria group bacterium]|nr:hypothetical protein [Patescibacteria group bacterium]
MKLSLLKERPYNKIIIKCALITIVTYALLFTMLYANKGKVLTLKNIDILIINTMAFSAYSAWPIFCRSKSKIKCVLLNLFVILPILFLFSEFAYKILWGMGYGSPSIFKTIFSYSVLLPFTVSMTLLFELKKFQISLAVIFVAAFIIISFLPVILVPVEWKRLKQQASKIWQSGSSN